jgi:uncharacterized protein
MTSPAESDPALITGAGDLGDAYESSLFFSFGGRLNRAKFWLATLVFVIAGAIIAGVVMGLTTSMKRGAVILGLALDIPVVISTIAVGLKRTHDRGHAIWWFLIFVIIPGAVLEAVGWARAIGAIEPNIAINLATLAAAVVGLWGLFELGCLRGTVGPNRYGPDPLQTALVVRERAILPYLVTLIWALIASFAAQLLAFAAVVWWWRGDIQGMYAAPYDGASVAIQVLVLNPVTIGVLLLAIRVARANPVEYLALVWPRLQDLIVGIIGIVVIIGATDGAMYFAGYPIVSQFQVDSYKTAAQEGWLAPLLFAAIIMAPAGEECTFRGYLFRGFARSERATWPAIVVISLLWTLPHVQYDWTGLSEIFVAGLFLGWVRWRSGSTLLTFCLHALFNLEGTIETILQVKYFS